MIYEQLLYKLMRILLSRRRKASAEVEPRSLADVIHQAPARDPKDLPNLTDST